MATRLTSWMTSAAMAGLLVVAGCGSAPKQTTTSAGSTEPTSSVTQTSVVATSVAPTTAASTAALPSSPPQTVSSVELAQVTLPSGEIVRLVEKTNPAMFCVAKLVAAKTQCMGMPPTTPTAGPMPQWATGHPLIGVFVFVVNAEFPTAVTVRDPAGPTLIWARSNDGRYLVIADPSVNAPSGPSASVPARSLEVVAPDGRVITVLAIPAYNAPGTTPTDPRVALLACLRGHGHGLDIPDPGTVPGASTTPGKAFPPAVAQAAWQVAVNVTGPPHESFVYDEAAYQAAGGACRGSTA